LDIGTGRRAAAETALQPASDKQNARLRIMEAAMEVAAESGALHVSLEAVARKAGISKGGLLYHFPKKSDLMRALVEHHLAGLDEATRKAAGNPSTPNGVARALIDVYLAKVQTYCQAPRPTGVFAALAENPDLMEPVRACQTRIVERIRSSAADPALSLVAFLVVEGLKALDLFEADPLTVDERQAVLDALARRLESDPAG